MNEQPYNPMPQEPLPGGQPASGHNPYEFILQADAKHPKGGDNFIKRILIAIGGIFLLFVIAAIALSVLLPGNKSIESMNTIATEQQSIATVAATAANQASSENAKAIALNTQLSLQTAANETMAYVEDNGGKIDKNFAKSDNTSAENQLSAVANAPTTYNATVHKVLGSLLSTYTTNLKQAYEQSDDPVVKQLLGQHYISANKLIEQNNATSD